MNIFNLFSTPQCQWICYIAKGIIVTLEYSIVAAFLGLILGGLLAIIRYSKRKPLTLSINIYISIIRGTPFLVQLFIIYFTIPKILDINIPIYIAGVLALAINSGAYVAEIIRGGIESIDKGQFEAARALSIPYSLMMKDIILPQAIKNSLPSLINEIVNLIKESAVIGIIGVADLMRRAQIVAAQQFDYLKPLCIAAVFYYLIISIIAFIGKKVEKKLNDKS